MLSELLGQILSRYVPATSRETFNRNSELFTLFKDLTKAFAQSYPVKSRPLLQLDWSVGKGIWARVPWLAFLDTRITRSTSKGVFGAILFRQDMSGFYVTLMQGAGTNNKRIGIPERDTLQTQTVSLRKFAQDLAAKGFQLNDGIDLRSQGSRGKAYEAATIAYKFYPANQLPDDSSLLNDLEALLSCYEAYVLSRFQEGALPPPEPEASQEEEEDVDEEEAEDEEALETPEDEAPEAPFDPATAIPALLADIRTRSFIFEPWQVAAFVTALRTKPFVILAGVSGTGKSKLPRLVAQATGAECLLIPVRPDWTDSSDILGYVDLKGAFRPGPFLEFAKKARDNPHRQHICIIDEMNLARVEHYFAEVLSRIEERDATSSDGKLQPLLSHGLSGEDAAWTQIPFPPNLAIVGTVNMDESTHGFSRKVLDRAFTLELSEVDLDRWDTASSQTSQAARPPALTRWPVSAWTPRALRLGQLRNMESAERQIVDRSVRLLTELNQILIRGQLQIGYRTRDEVALFALNALPTAASFVRENGASVDPLDLTVLMKLLPRIQGGSNAIRKIVLQLLSKATGKSMAREEDTEETLRSWEAAQRSSYLPGAPLPLTAARLCLMWDRLLNEGYTSFWL